MGLLLLKSNSLHITLYFEDPLFITYYLDIKVTSIRYYAYTIMHTYVHQANYKKEVVMTSMHFVDVSVLFLWKDILL